MIVDCESCPVRGVRCEGCMVTELYALEPPSASTTGSAMELDASERAAVAVFVDAGLVGPAVERALRARREPWAPLRHVG
jgi:hypothetical protein